jgi:arylsulfatase A-like enzyme
MFTRFTLLAVLAMVVGCGESPPSSKPARSANTAKAPAPNAQPNIVLILADDLGVDLVGAYGAAPHPPCTPNLDRMAARGMLFRNVWANPLCSPTRAQILTGQHGFRTGLGQGVKIGDPDTPGMTASLFTLPKALTGYDSSAVGKWHIASPTQGAAHPALVGFGYYSGSLFNLMEKGGGYSSWRKTTNGEVSRTRTYATTDTANDAVRRATEMAAPWFLYVAFNAPHLPAHEPPDELCPDSCAESFCRAKDDKGLASGIKAAVEAMDTEIGRMLEEIRRIDPNVIVIFVGDNGSASEVTEPPFDPARAKGTLYESGIRVPLIIDMPGMAGGECAGLVSTVDLFATICELARVDATTQDSVSLGPYLTGGATESIRRAVYAERFSPNFDLTQTSFRPHQHRRAIRDARYKLIRSTRNGETTDQFYDLQDDPFERKNLAKQLSDEQTVQMQSLVAELALLGVD